MASAGLLPLLTARWTVEALTRKADHYGLFSPAHGPGQVRGRSLPHAAAELTVANNFPDRYRGVSRPPSFALGYGRLGPVSLTACSSGFTRGRAHGRGGLHVRHLRPRQAVRQPVLSGGCPLRSPICR
jgi:hypothetical protein